jgi:Phospholipase_D-nuclease N-terminal
MPKVYIVGFLVILAVWVYTIIDIVLANPRRVRGLPKALWIAVAVLLPVIATILWFAIGKDRTRPPKTGRQVAPDDDPDFLRKLGSEKEQEERIRRLEQELADLDDDSTTKD